MTTPPLHDTDDQRVDKILLWFVEDHIDLRSMDSESKEAFDEDKDKAKSAILSLLAEARQRETDLTIINLINMGLFTQKQLNTALLPKESK